MSPKRGRHDIVMAILESAKAGMKKTNIMFQVKLNYAQLERYLSALKNIGFLVEEGGIWKTTSKGHQAVEACQICHRLIEEIA